ncbi:glycoside/pentoside/hexuronide:cation symporter, GPH family [Paenibacillaceae bacterium GAS479]|nr:glycoside/pentoside/hexuronide:cation symporter, GPH family [Paenibacillaceae bacterium GAS479]
MPSKRINSSWMYGLGMFAMMVPSQAFLSFYSYYYVDKLGLGIGMATLARSIYLIWDAVNQPLLGYWSDRTHTRFGRRKPWLYGALPAFTAVFILLFSVPESVAATAATGGLELFYWFLASLILFETASSVIWVNYGALLPELYSGADKRAKASAIGQGFQMLAILIGTAATPSLFENLGFGGMSYAYAALFLVCMLVFLRHLQEPPETRSQPPLPLIAAFHETLRNRNFWIFHLANSFAQTVNGLLSSMIPFYAKYALGIPESQVSLLLASIFVPVIPLVAIWYLIARRLGGLRSWRLALIVYGISALPLWFAEGLGGGIVAGIIVGFGLAGFLVTPAVLNGRIIDQDAEKTGRRREGVYTAVGGFVTRSSGLISALAFWIVGMLLGYSSGIDPGPNPELAFRWLISLVPVGLLAVSVAISFMYREEGEGADDKKADSQL